MLTDDYQDLIELNSEEILIISSKSGFNAEIPLAA